MKKTTTKGVVIKKSASWQDPKGPSQNPKIVRPSKGFVVSVKEPSPSSKASTSKRNGKVIIREERKNLRAQKF